MRRRVRHAPAPAPEPVKGVEARSSISGSSEGGLGLGENRRGVVTDGESTSEGSEGEGGE